MLEFTTSKRAENPLFPKLPVWQIILMILFLIVFLWPLVLHDWYKISKGQSPKRISTTAAIRQILISMMACSALYGVLIAWLI